MFGAAVRPTTLEVMITLAPADKCGTACLHSRNAPRTCTARVWSNASSGYSAIGAVAPLIPALAITMSSRPNRSSAASTAAFTCPGGTVAQFRRARFQPGFGDPRQEDAGAFRDERARRRHSDAALAAGDDRGLAVESPHGTNAGKAAAWKSCNLARAA